MISTDLYAGQNVAVLGLGRTGLAVAQALHTGGANVLVWDDGAAARDRAAAQGLTVQPLGRAEDMDGLSALITSPGIAHLYPQPHPAIAAAWAAGVPVDNDIGVFFASFGRQDWIEFDRPPKVVAVTGSNGKSTCSALIHHILCSAGRPAQLGGNIGRAVFDLDPPQDGGVIVLELSSYQTELARALTPDIAVLTNISPDHLDRHAGLGGYFAAKRRLFAEGGPDHAVIGMDELEGQFLANQLSQGPSDERVIRIYGGRKPFGAGWAIFARKGFLVEWRKGKQLANIDLRDFDNLPGVHNHQNACAAYAAARALGLGPRQIEAGLRSFAGLPHRAQKIAQKDSVIAVNDSKATNPDSAAKALAAFSRIRWICGGLEKDGGLGALQGSLGSVAKAYVIGREAEKFALQLGQTPLQICTTMDVAVRAALQDAQPGDTVLLSPAAASFDQYDNFETRGDDFVQQVASCWGDDALIQ